MFERLGALTGLLILLAGSAGATNYRVVPGSVVATDPAQPLAGSFEISVFDSQSAGGVDSVLSIDDFQLEFHGESFGPREPVEYDGLTALELRIADHIQFDGDQVTFAAFQIGGEVIDVNESGIVFRYLEFRAQGADAGTLVGEIDGGIEPWRITLNGVVSEVEQTFRFPPDVCPILIPPVIGPGPIGGGGVIVIGGSGDIGVEAGNLFHSFEEFDIDADEIVHFEGPVGGIARWTGSTVATPTLEELGITAPAGATVVFDGGELSVSTSGDLFIAGGNWDLPGLAIVRLQADGDITIEGALALATGVALHIEAGGDVVGDDGGVTPPGDIVITPGPSPFCNSLLPVFPPERLELGFFSLELSAAQLVEIDVRPHRVIPRSRGNLWVVIEGSDDLDVRDIDLESLRLGPDAAPVSKRGRSRALRYVDVNRDGAEDLIVRFETRKTGVQRGDEVLCLRGATFAGFAIEGCDEIDTRRPWRTGKHWYWSRQREQVQRSSDGAPSLSDHRRHPFDRHDPLKAKRASRDR